jgi:hypothetical protein
LLVSTEASEVEGVGEWLGVPMFFSSFAPEIVRQMVQEAGINTAH